MRLKKLRLSILFLIPLLAVAQSPRIGIVDFYGVKKSSEDKIRKALGITEGDMLPRSKAETEERIEAVPNVVRASLEATCCADGKAILYVGIEEKGVVSFPYHDEPDGNRKLPEEIMDAYRLFLLSVRTAVAVGEVGEDFSQGHSRMVNTRARHAQEAFIPLAEENQKLLQDVLRNAGDPEQRAIAAYVIGYVKTKRAVVDDLQYAMRDPDATVRNHAMRTLGGFAVLAMKDHDLGIKVEPTWFIEMLTSLVWTDRNNAAVALVNLTESRDERILSHLRERAMPALIEMARWKHLPHALPAFILLGRVQGIPEQEIQDIWSRGEREKLIDRALEKKKK
jgi:hypothetical protein